MKKIVISFSLLCTLISCKKENTTTSTNNENNNTDTVKNNVIVGKQGPTISDVEGNSYKTVYIGSQHWMAENLKASRYNNGNLISNLTDNEQWRTSENGAWCNYKNDEFFEQKYGKLYNWYVVNKSMNGDNVCPTGWHIPNDSDWKQLSTYLGGEDKAGGAMKEVGFVNWGTPNTNATNTSLFSGLPGGYRSEYGDFRDISKKGNWWSSSEQSSVGANRFKIEYNSESMSFENNSKKDGYSIRCIKD
jgi:uncharacterized protein (TIGR02145 family)